MPARFRARRCTKVTYCSICDRPHRNYDGKKKSKTMCNCSCCLTEKVESGKASPSVSSFKGIGTMCFLKREIAEMWKSGKLNKSWLNVRLKVPYIIGVSGDYAYYIRVRNPREVKYSDVPDFYKMCVKPGKRIFEYDAVLEKVVKRDCVRTARRRSESDG